MDADGIIARSPGPGGGRDGRVPPRDGMTAPLWGELIEISALEVEGQV